MKGAYLSMKNNNEKGHNDQNTTHYMPLYMCIGISLGLAIGVATDNLAVCMPIGLGAGVCLGSFLDRQNLKKERDDSEQEKEEQENENV